MISAIETLYRGHRFRSRLEARWAVFFDEIGLEFQYEPDAYELRGIRYLPDFYIPSLDCFIEIKPVAPTTEEANKCGWLAEKSQKTVYLFFGVPGSNYGEVFFGDGWDDFRQFCQCESCLKIGIEFDALANRIDCTCNDHNTPDYAGITNLILSAQDKAKAWRFEPGAVNAR